MISTFYFIGFPLFVVGLVFYIISSMKLSRDLKSGAIRVRSE